MSTVLSAIAPIWKVLIVGLVLGAGLPALFSVGIRTSAGVVGADGSTTAPTAAGRAVAVICFFIVGLVVVAGVVVLAASKTLLAKFGLS